MASRCAGSIPKNLTESRMITACCGLFLGVVIGSSMGSFGFSYKFGDSIFATWNSDPLSEPLSDPPAIETTPRPRGTEGLPPGIIVSETDLYQRRLWGDPKDDLPEIPSKYLVTFTVGTKQKLVVNSTVAKFPKEWTIMLFHYDGNVDEWNEFEWARTAIHVSARKQTKWWYAKRFLHPDVVAPYDYIFLWDEDLGAEHFDAEKYIELVRNYRLEISQPGVDLKSEPTWEITKRINGGAMHKTAVEKPGRCTDPLEPPCAGFIEIMAPVFSRKAWRCFWHMIQNDLVHGWGLDFIMRRCAEPAHENIGVVDAQWIQHLRIPSLGAQGVPVNGKKAWEAVKERCSIEWTILNERVEEADKSWEESEENL